MRFLLRSPVKTGKVLLRACCMLFKRNNELQVLYLRYTHRFVFKQSYLVIQCRCHNALFIAIKGYGVFTEKDIVLNINNLMHGQLQLTVQGLFGKRIFYLEVIPQWKLQTGSFKTAVKNWQVPAVCKTDFKLLHTNITVRYKKIAARPAISVKVMPVTCLPSLFNQADYI